MYTHYIRDPDGTIRTTDDLHEWGRWFETADRRIELTELANGGTLSTVFLGLDHNWLETGPPLLFETMTFGVDPEIQLRWATEEEARAGHRIVLATLGKTTLPRARWLGPLWSRLCVYLRRIFLGKRNQ